MNSFILSSIAAFCHSFANAFRKSGLCKLLMKIYNGISGSWKNSSVMTWIRNIGQNESNSVAVRIVRCPFTFLTFIKKKIGKFVESNIKKQFYMSLGESIYTEFYGGEYTFFRYNDSCNGCMLQYCRYAPVENRFDCRCYRRDYECV